ncbi:MAG: hypothetical protein GY838_09510 [bacterium]|nr:hypothetical protein [bacterium]
MFGVASLRRWVPVLLLGLLAVAFLGMSGCGKDEEVDPYVYDSLRRITRGDTLSVGFLFEIDAPEFEYVRGNVAIIRDGNLLEFLVAEDMENKYTSLSGALLGVRKAFTPQPSHLVLQRIKRGGVVQADSLPAPQGYTLPRLLRAGAIDLETPGAPLPEIGWSRRAIDEARTTFLPENEDDPLRPVQTGIERFAYLPRYDLADSVKANPSPEDFAWYALFEETFMEIVDVTPGADWMLNVLIEKDLPLVGSFSVVSLEDQFTARRDVQEGYGHWLGTLKINWFKYANTFVEGSEPE